MIHCNSLVLGYHNTSPLNQPFDFTIDDQQWLGIIGENGTGKSTFFKTLLRSLPPLAGTLQVNTQRIGYIPQERETNLSERMTGFTLVAASYRGWQWGLPSRSKKLYAKITHLMQVVGASDYMHQAFSTLSGGQKKRIYLVQSLINEPKLLLLDEPLADLDPEAKQHFIQALQAIKQHYTFSILIISHDMHEIAQHLDGFIHFKAGKVHFCTDLPCIKESAYVGI